MSNAPVSTCEHNLKLISYTKTPDQQRAHTVSLACTIEGCGHTRTVMTGKTPAQLEAILREQELQQ